MRDAEQVVRSGGAGQAERRGAVRSRELVCQAGRGVREPANGELDEGSWNRGKRIRDAGTREQTDVDATTTGGQTAGWRRSEERRRGSKKLERERAPRACGGRRERREVEGRRNGLDWAATRLQWNGRTRTGQRRGQTGHQRRGRGTALGTTGQLFAPMLCFAIALLHPLAACSRRYCETQTPSTTVAAAAHQPGPLPVARRKGCEHAARGPLDACTADPEAKSAQGKKK